MEEPIQENQASEISPLNQRSFATEDLLPSRMEEPIPEGQAPEPVDIDPATLVTELDNCQAIILAVAEVFENHGLEFKNKKTPLSVMGIPDKVNKGLEKAKGFLRNGEEAKALKIIMDKLINCMAVKGIFRRIVQNSESVNSFFHLMAQSVYPDLCKRLHTLESVANELILVVGEREKQLKRTGDSNGGPSPKRSKTDDTGAQPEDEESASDPYLVDSTLHNILPDGGDGSEKSPMGGTENNLPDGTNVQNMGVLVSKQEVESHLHNASDKEETREIHGNESAMPLANGNQLIEMNSSEQYLESQIVSPEMAPDSIHEENKDQQDLSKSTSSKFKSHIIPIIPVSVIPITPPGATPADQVLPVHQVPSIAEEDLEPVKATKPFIMHSLDKQAVPKSSSPEIGKEGIPIIPVSVIPITPPGTTPADQVLPVHQVRPIAEEDRGPVEATKPFKMHDYDKQVVPKSSSPEIGKEGISIIPEFENPVTPPGATPADQVLPVHQVRPIAEEDPGTLKTTEPLGVAPTDSMLSLHQVKPDAKEESEAVNKTAPLEMHNFDKQVVPKSSSPETGKNESPVITMPDSPISQPRNVTANQLIPVHHLEPIEALESPEFEPMETEDLSVHRLLHKLNRAVEQDYGNDSMFDSQGTTYSRDPGQEDNPAFHHFEQSNFNLCRAIENADISESNEQFANETLASNEHKFTNSGRNQTLHSDGHEKSTVSPTVVPLKLDAMEVNESSRIHIDSKPKHISREFKDQNQPGTSLMTTIAQDMSASENEETDDNEHDSIKNDSEATAGNSKRRCKGKKPREQRSRSQKKKQQNGNLKTAKASVPVRKQELAAFIRINKNHNNQFFTRNGQEARIWSAKWAQGAFVLSSYQSLSEEEKNKLPRGALDFFENEMNNRKEHGCLTHHISKTDNDHGSEELDNYRGLKERLDEKLFDVHTAPPRDSSVITETELPPLIKFTTNLYVSPDSTARQIREAVENNNDVYASHSDGSALLSEGMEAVEKEKKHFESKGVNFENFVGEQLCTPIFDADDKDLKTKMMIYGMGVVQDVVNAWKIDKNLFDIEKLHAKIGNRDTDSIRQLPQPSNTNFSLHSVGGKQQYSNQMITGTKVGEISLTSFVESYTNLQTLSEQTYDEIVKLFEEAEDEAKQLEVRGSSEQSSSSEEPENSEEARRIEAEQKQQEVVAKAEQLMDEFGEMLLRTGSIPINFLTNLDLIEETDKTMFLEELKTLEHMPGFLKPSGEKNLLDYTEEIIPGLNIPQVYTKFPGCRSTSHLENNSLTSVNINFGIASCVWFGVPFEHSARFEKFLEDRMMIEDRQGYGKNVMYKFANWPNEAEVRAAGIPLIKFMQRPGDMAFVNYGTYHWVQSNGFCTNLSWNVAQPTFLQLATSGMVHDHFVDMDKLSLMPIEHTVWKMAEKKVKVEKKMYDLIKVYLMRSIAHTHKTKIYLEKKGVKLNQARDKQLGTVVRCRRIALEEECGKIAFNYFAVSKNVKHCLSCAEKVKTCQFFEVTPIENMEKIYDDYQFESLV